MGNTCAYKQPCGRGTCFNLLGTRRCDCSTGFDGSRGETGVKYTRRFSRRSFKRVPANSKVNLLWSVSMRFRTAKPSGTLFEISFSSSSSVPELVDGKLSYNYKELLVLQLPHIAVNDTQWHHKSDMNYQKMYLKCRQKNCNLFHWWRYKPSRKTQQILCADME
nr:uncharacterized protein LOC131774662 [Pocillopora verrucosa]